MGHFPVRGASEPPLWQRLRRAMSTDSQKEARCREVREVREQLGFNQQKWEVKQQK